MSRRSLTIDILVPVITFLAGVVVPIIFDKLTNGAFNEQQLTLLIILSFVLVLVALIIANATFFRETHSGQETIISEQKQIISSIELLAQRFGLVIEFIKEPLENSGITYERTRQLIENAQESLVFLDAWVQTTDYFFGTPLAQQKRQAYYNAILKQIEKHEHDGDTFHRRIIQVSKPFNELDTFVMMGGTVFIDYIKRCLKLHKNSPATCVVKIAPLFLQAHFVIIDQQYVVWPLLTYTPRGRGLQRHGAMIFHDPLKQFVPLLMEIYNRIDSEARPFQLHHLGVSDGENP